MKVGKMAFMDDIIEQTLRELRDEECPAPDRLVRDLANLLTGRDPQSSGEGNYENLLQAMTRNRRWRILAAQFQMGQRRLRRNEEERTRQASGIMQFVVKSLAYRLVHFCAWREEEQFKFSCPRCGQHLQIEVGSASAQIQCPACKEEIGVPNPPPPPVTLERIGDGFEDWQGQNDPIVDAYTLVGAGIARRAKMSRFVDQWLHRELILACLGEEWDTQRYVPRPLRRILREGDEEARLAGELSSVRGITVKTREDQLKDLLPEELRYLADENETVMHYGYNHIMNEQPLILEHHQPKRPEVRQRILLMIIVGAEQRRESAPAKRAHVMARKLAFNMLVAAGLKVPHESVDVDVGWFEQRDAQWIGAAFPLGSLTVEAQYAENWRNVMEVDRLLPHFFVRWMEGEAAGHRREQPVLREAPSVYLERAVAKHLYHGAVVAVVMKNEEKSVCLPPPSTLLPRLDRRANAVLLASVADGERFYRGDGFRDLVGAGVASLPLSPAEEEHLVETFITMLVGPVAAKNKAVAGTTAHHAL